MTNLAIEIESYLKNSFGIVVDSHSSSLVSNGLIDSMQVVDVAMFLETLADVTLDETDLIVENFDSVEAMATLVTSKT
jgi:acyl carrier protein